MFAANLPFRQVAYTSLLLFVAGMGGLLYGYDIGIIGVALLYLGKSINLTLREESLVVAAVLAGSTLSSLVAGMLADWVGRKKLMIMAAILFIGSVLLIVSAHDFRLLFTGRALQGLSAGMIAVVIPLYLAESLPTRIRGSGTAGFQLLLTCGILLALAIGTVYTKKLTAMEGGDAVLLAQAQDRAWRGMFWSALYPALVFLAGAFCVTESPRWLLRQGLDKQARSSLGRSRASQEAEAEFTEMARSLQAERTIKATSHDSLWQRKYVMPFLLACAILGLTQATGIKSLLQFLVLILQHAGLDAMSAAKGATCATIANVLFTVVGLIFVDRVGRKGLLKTGTAGIVVALVMAAGIFYSFESRQIDVTAAVSARVVAGGLVAPVDGPALGLPPAVGSTQLAVLYSINGEERLASGFSQAGGSELKIAADAQRRPLTIKRAKFGPVPSAVTGYCVTACLILFFASFSLGPGVCVWLALSELMPMRIRSIGMGLGLFVNQGTSTVIAALFLPLAGNFGYAAVFMFWAGCTVVYFLIAAVWLPETKGKMLEEIETLFAGRGAPGVSKLEEEN